MRLGELAPVFTSGCCVQGPFAFDIIGTGAYSVNCVACGQCYSAAHVVKSYGGPGKDGDATAFQKFFAKCSINGVGFSCSHRCSGIRRTRLKQKADAEKAVEIERKEYAAGLKADAKKKKDEVAVASAVEKDAVKAAALEIRNSNFVMAQYKQIVKKQKAAAEEAETQALYAAAVTRGMGLAITKHGPLASPPDGVNDEQQLAVLANAAKSAILSGVRQRRKKKALVPVKVKTFLPPQAHPSAFVHLPAPRLIGSGKNLKFRWSGKPAEFDNFFCSTAPSWRAPVPVAGGHDLLCPKKKDRLVLTFFPGDAEVSITGQHRFGK